MREVIFYGQKSGYKYIPNSPNQGVPFSSPLTPSNSTQFAINSAKFQFNSSSTPLRFSSPPIYFFDVKLSQRFYKVLLLYKSSSYFSPRLRKPPSFNQNFWCKQLWESSGDLWDYQCVYLEGFQ